MDAIATHAATGAAVIALGGKSIPDYLRSDLRHLAPEERTVLLDPDAMKWGLRLCAREPGGMYYRIPLDPADLFNSDHPAKRGTIAFLQARDRRETQ